MSFVRMNRGAYNLRHTYLARHELGGRQRLCDTAASRISQAGRVNRQPTSELVFRS